MLLPPISLFLTDKITPGLYIDLRGECQVQLAPVQGQILNPYEWVHVLQFSSGKVKTNGCFLPSQQNLKKDAGISVLYLTSKMNFMAAGSTRPICWCCILELFSLLHQHPQALKQMKELKWLLYTHLLVAVFSVTWMWKWEPRFFYFKPSLAQWMLCTVTLEQNSSPVHLYFPWAHWLYEVTLRSS